MIFFKYTVGTIQSRIAKKQDRRTSLAIFNNSSNTLYIGNKGQNTNGFIVPAGGSVSFAIPEDDPTGELWAVASAANSDIRVYEGFGK